MIAGVDTRSWVWAEFSAFIFGVLQFEFMEVRAKGSVQGSDFRGSLVKAPIFEKQGFRVQDVLFSCFCSPSFQPPVYG